MPLPPLPPLRAVSFDWGDTLAANTGMPYRAVQERAFARFAADLTALGAHPPADLPARCMADQEQAWYLSIDPVRNPDGHEMDYAALFSGWLALSGADASAAQSAVERCEDELVEVLGLFASVQPVFSELKRRGYRIGILSHIIWTGPACRRYFHRHGLGHLIDAYSFSSEVGHAKPHPAHYADLVAKLGIAAGDTLHVGDNPGRDIAGANTYGFLTCLLETGGVHDPKHLAACAPDLRIVRLNDLLEILP